MRRPASFEQGAPAPPLGAAPPSRLAKWLSWLMGAAALAAVIAVALHFSEEREFLHLVERARPWWVLWAFLFQAATYLAQGQTWRAVTQAGRSPISLRSAYQLSLAKLFVDQALPSGGFSGTVVVANALERRGVPRPVVMASVVVNTASHYAAYLVSLGAALIITAVQGHASELIISASVLFAAFGAALVVGVLVLSGRQGGRVTRAVSRIGWVRRGLELLRLADPKLARSPSLLLRASGYQLAIIACDSATVFALVRSLGVDAPASGVFASFMISSLFRTVSIVPGGLGTFEAASVLTLKLAGISVPVALSATLLFRGLSFWLPMLPGLYFSRRTAGRGHPAWVPPRDGAYWALGEEELLRRLGSNAQGLSAAEAGRRLAQLGPNELRAQARLSRIRVVWRQLRSPLVLLLVFAATVSLATGGYVDSAIVVTIVVASTGIGYSREYRAQLAVAELRARVMARATVLRDGRPQTIAAREIVRGDLVLLSAGSLVPADAVLLEATDFFVNEAVLTGESYPVEKKPGASPAAAPLARRLNVVFQGTNVRTGGARALVVSTGAATEFGGIAHRLTLRPPETEFDRGIRRFGYLLTIAMTVMVLLVFAANVVLGRPAVETLLFSVALAVGLSPELLPAILSVNLARGAQMMARHGVLVRRLASIENLGSMDVLCTDKTGTLTEGVIRVEGAYAPSGERSEEVLELASLNAALQAGIANPLDQAILQARRPDLSRVQKAGEIPYDFVRKRLSVVVRAEGRIRLVTKGAFELVLEACTRTFDGGPLDAHRRRELEDRFRQWSGAGIRVLAVATRDLEEAPSYGRADERELTFAGFVTFLDRPKEGVAQAISDLAALGVSVKLITGDTRLVAEHVAKSVGMRAERVLTGRDLDELHDEALWRAAEGTDLFVEVDPNQKERIILSLKKMRHVVGFLGDGINDAPAMHAADTSLSVERAVDVARDAADFVLLERHLDVIRRGITEGRRTFANTLKYVLTTGSANLGNMMSMAVASAFLPFLPLTAGQILLNNFLADVPAVGLASDSVDPELVDQPRRWDIRFIGRFMVEFGILSSVFDLLTFGALLFVFRAAPELFRTGWWVESMLTQLVIALVVRTRRPFFRSRPGTLLLAATVAIVALAFALPYLPVARIFGFVPPPAPVIGAVVAIASLYVVSTELLKARFYRGAR